MIHHGFKKGKRVLVILNNSEKIIGKFKDSGSNYLELEDRKIRWSDIRSSTIYKDRTVVTDFLGGDVMKIDKLQVGRLQANCYFISKDNDLIIVDPGDDYDKIKARIDKSNLKAIFLTHGHFDHNGAVKELIDDYSAPLNPPAIESFNYKTISTPGHTEDSVSFYFPEEKVMLTGDFLFRGTIGRTDFPGGSIQEVVKSLEEIRKYSDNIKIYPGHGEETTLGDEKKNFDGYFNSLSKC